MVRRKAGIDMVRASIEAEGDSGMLHGVIRKEELRPNHGRGRVREGVVDECREPARGGNSVIVQEDDKLTGRCRDSSVAGTGETERGLVANDDNAVTECRKKRWGPVSRSVVDDDKLPIDPVIGLGEERIKA